jgi:elongation factor P--(R)-beta-lysine ligase
VARTRGRVIAVDGPQAQAVVRCEQFDLRVTHPPVAWKPGDHVDVDRGVVMRSFGGGDYPGPGSEVMRMPRPRVDRVHARAKALAKLREVFAARGFLEVETPLLVPSPGLEIHLDAVRAGAGYLITSPEYQMKRLLAAGFERIYQVCKCFRANEEGTQHSSEFTMIEWYRAFEGIDAIVEDTEQLVHAVCGDQARVGARHIDVKPPWRRMAVRDAMREHAGVHVDGAEPAGDLVAEVRRAGIDVADDTAWDDAFFAAFLARVEPAIAALDHALVLEDWPAPLAALARRKDGDPKTALRFEAYVGGIELANAFDELTDPIEQRARFLDEQRIRAERGKPVYPLDEKLLAALAEGLPPSAGIALGFDRLVMLATGAEHIRQVLAFTTDEL